MDKIKIGTINIDWCKKTKARLKLVQKVLRSEKFDFLVVQEDKLLQPISNAPQNLSVVL